MTCEILRIQKKINYLREDLSNCFSKKEFSFKIISFNNKALKIYLRPRYGLRRLYMEFSVSKEDPYIYHVQMKNSGNRVHFEDFYERVWECMMEKLEYSTLDRKEYKSYIKCDECSTSHLAKSIFSH